MSFKKISVNSVDYEQCFRLYLANWKVDQDSDRVSVSSDRAQSEVDANDRNITSVDEDSETGDLSKLGDAGDEA